jgi:uncharacterized membrane protein YkgB
MVIVIQFGGVRQALRPIGSRFGSLERKYALPCLRYSLAIVFFWFGIIKPLGRTPATMLVGETLAATPVLRTFVPFSVFMPVLGWWEAIVGLGLLFRRTIRLAVGCMMVQMGATFVPLFVVPDVTFHTPPFFPTTPGFYVMKNFVLLSGGLVVASHFDGIRWRWDRVVAFSRDHSPRRWNWRLPGSVAPLQRTTLRILRAGLRLVFLWSGMLHLSGMGEMGGWIATVVQPLLPSGILVPLIGALELSIGLGLVTRRTTTVAAYLAVVYLLLSLLPLLLRPALAFNGIAVTFEGAYLIKDWVLVSAVFVVDRGDVVPS